MITTGLFVNVLLYTANEIFTLDVFVRFSTKVVDSDKIWYIVFTKYCKCFCTSSE